MAANWSGLRVRVESELGMAVFRSHRARLAAAAARVGRACGCKAPLIANTTIAGGALRLSWLAPCAWFLAGPVDAVQAALSAIAAGSAAPLVIGAELTAGRVAIEVTGSRSRALIATGCPLEVSDRVMPRDACAASLYNDIPVWIDRLSDEPAFRVVCERPLAHGLWAQLADAADLLG